MKHKSNITLRKWQRSKKGNLYMVTAEGKWCTVFQTDDGNYKFIVEGVVSGAFETEREAQQMAEKVLSE